MLRDAVEHRHDIVGVSEMYRQVWRVDVVYGLCNYTL